MAPDPVAFLIIALKSMVWAGGVLVAIRWVGKGEVARRRWLALVGLWAMPLVLWVSPEQLPVAVGRSGFASEVAARSPGLLLQLAVAIWLGGTALFLARVIWEAHGVRRLIETASPCQRSREHAGIPVLLSLEVPGPCLAGWWQPRILMPVEAKGWSEAHWRAALDHEAEHARRGDGWHRLFTSLAMAFWWWNPAVRRLIKIYEVESECLCDAAAVRHCEAIDYGRFLLATAGYPLRSGMVVSMAGGMLHQRVERLVAPAGRQGKWRWLAMVCAALVLAGAGGVCASFGIVRPGNIPTPGPERAPEAVAEEAHVRWDADPFPAP